VVSEKHNLEAWFQHKQQMISKLAASSGINGLSSMLRAANWLGFSECVNHLIGAGLHICQTMHNLAVVDRSELCAMYGSLSQTYKLVPCGLDWPGMAQLVLLCQFMPCIKDCSLVRLAEQLALTSINELWFGMQTLSPHQNTLGTVAFNLAVGPDCVFRVVKIVAPNPSAQPDQPDQSAQPDKSSHLDQSAQPTTRCLVKLAKSHAWTVDEHCSTDQLSRLDVLLKVAGNLSVCMSGDEQHILAVEQNRVCVLDLSGKIVWEHCQPCRTAWWASNNHVAIAHNQVWQCFDIRDNSYKLFAGTSSAIHDNVVLTAQRCDDRHLGCTIISAFDYLTGETLAMQLFYDKRRVVGVHARQNTFWVEDYSLRRNMSVRFDGTSFEWQAMSHHDCFEENAKLFWKAN
jgi:hypothetical protein